MHVCVSTLLVRWEGMEGYPSLLPGVVLTLLCGLPPTPIFASSRRLGDRKLWYQGSEAFLPIPGEPGVVRCISPERNTGTIARITNNKKIGMARNICNLGAPFEKENTHAFGDDPISYSRE